MLEMIFCFKFLIISNMPISNMGELSLLNTYESEACGHLKMLFLTNEDSSRILRPLRRKSVSLLMNETPFLQNL